MVTKISTKGDFIKFLEVFLEDLKSNSNEWENTSLSSYIEAMAAWTDDMEGYYTNNNLEIPDNINWKVFANILVAAAIYE
ncbi:MAG: hypothetical protein EAZ70_04805 [Runella slithyformis]|nr:MAG: hypothetical protein EAY79_05165 [Runella slithyformis]TAF28679.1 MAG: hypothetical protein EAZ70_04805 [Runella slithyformis]TAF82396.1 MAG: hypothetical protein EAZ50_04310 [Runella slithyformis]